MSCLVLFCWGWGEVRESYLAFKPLLEESPSEAVEGQVQLRILSSTSASVLLGGKPQRFLQYKVQEGKEI